MGGFATKHNVSKSLIKVLELSRNVPEQGYIQRVDDEDDSG